ncbi:MAG: hypothetical protein KDI03_13270 [Anaerolineae bacterium]|nr:hypothetical protein [Anaerolineae bacterium]MCB0201034.1 hypothetical protein [Anaerolineae bacterium]
MSSETRNVFLLGIKELFGDVQPIGTGRSVFEIGSGAARVYVRYSKVHRRTSGASDRFLAWFGLRNEDLRLLEGHKSFLCLLWEDQVSPLVLPYADYEEIFQSEKPSSDGQFKVQVHIQDDGTDFYIARVGRFKVDGFFGWEQLEAVAKSRPDENHQELNHSQIQTLLGAIGAAKNFNIWIPINDRSRLDWALAPQFDCVSSIPSGYEQIAAVLGGVDVIWLRRGSGQLVSLFEVEYSTPIYSGLLRFNDINLVTPGLNIRYNIVAKQKRRKVFARHLRRPTFRTSGLNERVSFLEFIDVLEWYRRVHQTTVDESFSV